MSGPITRNCFSSVRSSNGGTSYRTAIPRPLPVPLMSQENYPRNNRFGPYTGSGRFQQGFETRGPTQQSKNRNQKDYGNIGNRDTRLRMEMNRLTYSEALKEPTSNQVQEELKESVTLQISNLDPTIEEHNIRHYLFSQLKSITPVMSLIMETPSTAKLKVPSNVFAKQVHFHI